MTFAEALKVHQQSQVDDVTIKPSTRHYWNQIFVACSKVGRGSPIGNCRRIGKTDCNEWARKFRKGASATRSNNTIAGLRHVFQVAIDGGIVYGNPAANLERLPVRAKQLTLPSAGQFLQLVETIRTAGAWCSRDCADFVEGLAVTGARKAEAGGMEWRDLDFKAGEIVIRGHAETGTKNWTVLRGPMIPAARELFQRMRAERPDEPLTAKVFQVREAQKAINAACKKLGIPRITHHDLRHLFATVCIESGVDILTVSRWLNHKDGGALAMKTYGHLRREHSIAQAQRVTFAPVSAANRHRSICGNGITACIANAHETACSFRRDRRQSGHCQKPWVRLVAALRAYSGQCLSFLSNYSDLLKDSAALNAFNIRRLSSRVVGGPFDLSVPNSRFAKLTLPSGQYVKLQFSLLAIFAIAFH